VAWPVTTSPPPADDVDPGGHSSAAAVPEGRGRYLNALVALALIGIVTFHQFGWHWLPLAFPSMGVLFAVAGSRVAGDLTRARGNYWTVLYDRLRRLLPPVWVFGLVIIPVMVARGWTATSSGGGDALRHWRLMLFWLLPVATPPSSDWGFDFVQPLWFVQTYLWLLLVSPALLFLFRRWPKRLIVVPLAIVAASTFGIVDLTDGRSSAVLLAVGIYGACWMVGFAYHDRRLERIPRPLILLVALTLLGGGLAWALTHQSSNGWRIDDIPLTSALWSLGAVLFLLLHTPSLSWMSRVPVVDKTVEMIRNRILTIYLWHNVAIVLAVRLLDSNRRTAILDNTSVLGSVVRYGTTWLLTIIACVLFGWVEDLAARRPVRIIPWPRAPRHPSRPSQVAAGSWLARLPLRNRPLLLTCSAIVAAAFVAGALLWPWSEHHTYRAPVGSLGQAVDPHGNGARSPVHSGPPASQPDQLPAPTGSGPTPPQATVDPRNPPALRGGLTQQPSSAPTGSSASAAPGRSGSAVPSSGPAGSPGSPTATAAPTSPAAQSTAASSAAPSPTASPTVPVPTSAAPSLPAPSPQVPSGSGLVGTTLPP
jgi:hypothetical protein